ncbi:MAG: ATP-dependent DNA helicase RecG [Flavobacteriales bacterium TMED123]|nr:MAG: ATP-dependent DNA helicase RecG [Flavobacteriales bacterium TMED123]|tara:strand:- start:3733 stop:5829 length:2097 start_codon:yes stop_codon:yes gene_type:complete
MHFLDTPIAYLKGVGPMRADLLNKELNIFTFSDLLTYYPFRYTDRSKLHKISSLNTEMPYIQLKGRIIRFEEKGQKRSKRLIAHFQDESGITELIWFKGIRWIKQAVKLNTDYLVFGKPSVFQNSINIVHPEIDVIDSKEVGKSPLQPVYHSSEKLSAKGLNSKGIHKLLKELLPQIIGKIDETLSDNILSRLVLPNKEEALMNIHNPKGLKSLERAQKRLKFEELFFLQFHLLKMKLSRTKKLKGFEISTLGKSFNTYYDEILQFELTNAQKKVLKEIRADVKKRVQMNRLLQGDVGSGKTLVALLSILMVVDNNYQACMMAPTEILAQQHFNNLSADLSKLNVKIALLTGSIKNKERKILLEELENGAIDILIGTHALLEDSVVFKNLGFVVIDEQHRFGVAQRAKLWKKNTIPPHILVMTATPIPRTLSMTLYGDLDVSVIGELPPGRKEVKTLWRSDSSRLRVNKFMREQIEIGRQIYVVYPLIQESEKLDYKDLMDGYKAILGEFPMPDFQVSVVHGRMKAEDKEYEMKRFVDGITNIMVATTVIEVGVDVPNASVMLIESAERFGLSQLHQLRGRVGRGAEQSYCILLSGHKISNEGKIRLETMASTNDGFKISEVDLKLRGPGDMMGTRQSGMLNFKIADLIKDGKILAYARKEAENLLEEDDGLVKAENINFARAYKPYAKERIGWSRIS